MLFETDPNRPDRSKRRESTWLELKENFSRSHNAKIEYGRTMAAFANRDGGYILFGIQNSPHLMVGMTNNHFEQLDPRTLSQFMANKEQIEINGFTTKTRTFGSITTYKIKIGNIEAAIVKPQRARHPEDIIEIIAPINLRDSLKLKDKDKVKIS